MNISIGKRSECKNLLAEKREGLNHAGVKRILTWLAMGCATVAIGVSAQSERQTVTPEAGFQYSQGGIIRGPVSEKKIALEFTAHEFGESGETVLRALKRHHAKASFFVTGDFASNPTNAILLRKIVAEGNYLGPHGGHHLLYCPWSGPKKTLVTSNEFVADLDFALLQLRPFTGTNRVDYWLPAYEWYNGEIVDWSRERFALTLVNYTPGTRANADYMLDKDPHFISSKAIAESIFTAERSDPHGLNGYLLLMHLGTGPGRTDKMAKHLAVLLDELSGEGYQFVRVDELLSGHPTR